MFKFKYQIFDCFGNNLCSPGFDTFKEAVDMAKAICVETFRRRGDATTLFVDRVNGEWDFERILMISSDENGVKAISIDIDGDDVKVVKI